MKAIQTRYLGPTNHKPARIKVWIEGQPPMVLSVHVLDTDDRDSWAGEDNHRRAAVALCRRYNWGPVLVSGALPNGDFCHVWGHPLRDAAPFLKACGCDSEGPDLGSPWSASREHGYDDGEENDQ